MDLKHRVSLPEGVVRHVHLVARRTSSDGDRHEYVGALMDITDATRTQETRIGLVGSSSMHLILWFIYRYATHAGVAAREARHVASSSFIDRKSSIVGTVTLRGVQR